MKCFIVLKFLKKRIIKSPGRDLNSRSLPLWFEYQGSALDHYAFPPNGTGASPELAITLISTFLRFFPLSFDYFLDSCDPIRENNNPNQ